MSTTNLFRLSGRVECSRCMQGGDPSPSRRPAKSGGQIRSVKEPLTGIPFLSGARRRITAVPNPSVRRAHSSGADCSPAAERRWCDREDRISSC
jgi:hypothetical protein